MFGLAIFYTQAGFFVHYFVGAAILQRQGTGASTTGSRVRLGKPFANNTLRATALSLALARIGFGVAGITFARVRGCIAGARTGIGRAHTRISFGIAGASARIGRTFARIGCSVAGIAFTPVRGCVRRVSAILAFLLIGVFLTRALVGTFARVCGGVFRVGASSIRLAALRSGVPHFRTDCAAFFLVGIFRARTIVGAFTPVHRCVFRVGASSIRLAALRSGVPHFRTDCAAFLLVWIFRAGAYMGTFAPVRGGVFRAGAIRTGGRALIMRDRDGITSRITLV